MAHGTAGISWLEHPNNHALDERAGTDGMHCMCTVRRPRAVTGRKAKRVSRRQGSVPTKGASSNGPEQAVGRPRLKLGNAAPNQSMKCGIGFPCYC